MLEKKFKTLCQNFSQDEKLIEKLWQEIKLSHTQDNRYYHNLQHLKHLYQELEALKLNPLFEFSIFYHDIIYEVKRTDNEKQSALLAQNRLQQLEVPKKLNEKVFGLIIETKTHKASSQENELFLDADLSILGANEKRYKHYTQNVRQEYEIYDNATYFTGRKKVLTMFLEKDKIYESKHFYDKYEKQARVNLLIEYNSLI